MGGVSIQGGRINEGDVDYQWSVFEELKGPWKKDKKDIEAMGVKIEGEDCAGNKINYNNIEGNAGFGVESKVPAEVDARFNYWGDPSELYHPENREGTGIEMHGEGKIL